MQILVPPIALGLDGGSEPLVDRPGSVGKHRLPDHGRTRPAQPGCDRERNAHGRGSTTRRKDCQAHYRGPVTASLTIPADDASRLQSYAHPERLVTTDWLADHLEDENLVIVESDEDVLLYETGHIPGAVKVDWHTELNDPVTRDYVDGAGFAARMSLIRRE